ncbi:MAG: UvrD-helicase domain-containing protein, partial [Pseudomonadales bacterium]|nr:UvrD-helicase domain-containing protein [Pseudomonadales bacterium]
MSLNNREVSETSQRPGRETTARRDAPLPTPPDIEQRRRAAYPSGSFLVQAPAGSGKTTLLVERFLALLAHVSSPEEILAITFTRKAAKEMRSRVLKKLAHPQDDVSRGALEHNARKGWDLLANPQRLKIQTIDSFAYSLVQRLPYASRLGLDYQTLDSASIYYSDAASGLIQSVLSPQSLNQDVICFLADLVDNDFDKAVKLVADMLQRRDQWIGVVSSTVQAHVGDATPDWEQLLKTGREFLV